jgi:hypothetical protein
MKESQVITTQSTIMNTVAADKDTAKTVHVANDQVNVATPTTEPEAKSINHRHLKSTCAPARQLDGDTQ